MSRWLDRHLHWLWMGPLTLGYVAFLASVIASALLTSGCASLQGFAGKAEQVRAEAAALYLAADELDRECAELQEPRPSVCEAARRMMEAIQPYAPVVLE